MLVRKTMLGSTATWAVIGRSRDRVALTPVDVPGLEEGIVVWVTKEAFDEMTVVDEDGACPG